MPKPPVTPRQPKEVLRANPYCEPLRSMYTRLTTTTATSWNQVEDDFLAAMSAFDAGLPAACDGDDQTKQRQSKELSGALQNGKGDWFNNVIAYLLERCANLEDVVCSSKRPRAHHPGAQPGRRVPRRCDSADRVSA